MSRADALVEEIDRLRAENARLNALLSRANDERHEENIRAQEARKAECAAEWSAEDLRVDDIALREELSAARATADGWRERYKAQDAEHMADMARRAKAHAEVVESLAAERDEAIARIAELEAALAPFARFADAFSYVMAGYRRNDHVVALCRGVQITFADCKRARDVLEE